MAASDSGDSYVETLSSTHLTIGCFVFPRQDQIDFTGPFEVLSRIPNSTVHVIAKTKNPEGVDSDAGDEPRRCCSTRFAACFWRFRAAGSHGRSGDSFFY